MKSPAWLSSKLTCVPTHSAGPSTTSQSTFLPGTSSTTFMSKPPGTKRNAITPPASSGFPVVSRAHHPESPSSVVRAA